MNANLMNTIWEISSYHLTLHEKAILIRLASLSNYQGTTEPIYLENFGVEVGIQRLVMVKILGGLRAKSIIYGDIHFYNDWAVLKSYSINIVELEKLKLDDQHDESGLLELDFLDKKNLIMFPAEVNC